MYHLRKSLILLILLNLLQFSTPRDTIATGQTLKDGESLLSVSKFFALGFFSPGVSKNRYLGIWYNNVSENSVVWVANRDNPINNTSGVLSFEKSGKLVIYGPDPKIPVWSSNSSGPGKNYSVKLLDTGNLVVFGADSEGVTLWQSFEHPTDTMLPMMKIGASRKTGVNWSLTSWKSFDDPGTGEYSYRMKLGEYSELSLYKGSTRIWRTGPWNGVRLTGVPEMTTSFIFNCTYVENEDEASVMYGIRDPTIFTKMVVNHSGVVERMTWHPDRTRWGVFWSAPKDPCDYYGHCGSNTICDFPSPVGFECKCLPGFEPKSPRDWDLRDGSGGCVRKRDSNVCRSGEGFLKASGAKIPETTMTRVNRSLGLKECEVRCLRDCNCTAYTSVNVSGVGSGCVHWYENLMDIRQYQSGGEDFFLRADAVEVALSLKRQHSSSQKDKVAAVVASVGGAVVLLTVFLLCCLTKKRKEKRRLSMLSQTYSKAEQFDETPTSADLPTFDFKTIAEATDSFSYENKLGQGGFGSVYKGTIKSGQVIAVKRLSKSSGQGAEEFKNEATLIAKLQHRNLVRLLGYCVQQDEKMLIYEYLPNKSLDSLIFDQTEGSCLDWAQRFSIIMGITRGMVYLHHDSRLRIIHRDLKASNVLLDAAMNPKISDFGMARMFGGDQIEDNTNRVVGTYGYMAPEYAMGGHFSTKSDVYSFGVLLLEITSGKKNSSYFQDDCVNLVGHVWDLWREDRALEIVDPSLGDSYSAKEVLRCMHVGLLSVQEQAIDRPTMSEVAYMFANETALPPPRQPAFIFKNTTNQHSSSGSVEAPSINDVTLSVIDGR